MLHQLSLFSRQQGGRLDQHDDLEERKLLLRKNWHIGSLSSLHRNIFQTLLLDKIISSTPQPDLTNTVHYLSINAHVLSSSQGSAANLSGFVCFSTVHSFFPSIPHSSTKCSICL
jgi:hypothetical protein